MSLLGATMLSAVTPLWFGPSSHCLAAGDVYVYGSENDGHDNVDGQFGPYDYYRPPANPPAAIALVERAHMGFVIEEQFRAKDYCGYFGSLNYTLRAFPNHPEALRRMGEFLNMHAPCYGIGHASQRRSQHDPQKRADALLDESWKEITADFYFMRALNFMTEDTRVIPKRAEPHVLYGDWLRGKGRLDEAMKQYYAARALDPGFADTYYGLGMLYFDLKEMPKAVENAKKAHALGRPVADLRDRLIAAKAWSDTVDKKQQR